jgi:hypothetical protein
MMMNRAQFYQQKCSDQKWSEKARKHKTYLFCQTGQKNDQRDVLA